LDYVASINSGAGLCGYHDWRLPNVNALESLVNAGEADSAAWLNSQGFTNVTSSTYWSSTTSARNTSNAWTVLMGMGQSGAMGKSGTIDVWPVRSTSGIFKSVWQTGQKASYAARDDGALPEGHDWPSPRFQNYSDGTTFDHLTGLMWSKNANLPNGRKTWSAALAYVKTLNTGGHSDWRLPNREELFSLIDRSKYSPAVLVSSSDPEFQNIQTDYYYWSSTTELSHPDYAFTVDMGDGIVDRGYKNNTFYVWPVR
jgi:hypothetical protein